ncbi:hypothetical protein IB267_18100 [Ensifer sp. ENS09]|uniref:hypothetical protein n=1 Tax=Ensifer sp. ENS09 TaxID=2769263 RepID=UPI00178685D4|nr:hypothetical protein [Ensifer sp. ENS09]MBD9650262.1 hypothetical protein [Ensifer sp. ENS09]
MTDTQGVQFYVAIRKDTKTLDRFAQAGSEAELIELIMDEADKRGFASTEELVRSALSDLGTIVQQAAGGDELTEMELEIVSGGYGQVRGPTDSCGRPYQSVAKRG